MALEAELAAKEEEEQESREQYERIRYQKTLDAQLLEKQRENNAAYAVFLEEKRLIDEVIAKVKAEQRAARLEVVAR